MIAGFIKKIVATNHGETRFLTGTDYLEGQPQLFAHPRDEVRAILSLAAGFCCDTADMRDFPRAQLAANFRQRIHGAFDRRIR